MEFELSKLGLGDSIDPATMVVALLAVLALACLGPLLAMGGRIRGDYDEGGHPLRTKLYSAKPDRSPPR